MKIKFCNSVFKLLCFLVFSVYSEQINAQNITVTGTVKDASGQSLIGVSVQLKGDAKIGTTTDVQGKFTLAVPENYSLTFYYRGFNNQLFENRKFH